MHKLVLIHRSALVSAEHMILNKSECCLHGAYVLKMGVRP